MSNGKKKTPSFEDKMTAFSKRIEKALEKERKERAAERAADRAADRKEREKHRRKVAVEMGQLRDMWGQQCYCAPRHYLD